MLCLVSGLSINAKFLVVQYHIEGGIDVYNRVSLKHLFRLQGKICDDYFNEIIAIRLSFSGHEYGGQCVELSAEDLLYSASMDFSLKVWNLDQQKLVESVTDHCDYVQCLTVRQNG